MPYLDNVNQRLNAVASISPNDLVVGISKVKIKRSFKNSFDSVIANGPMTIETGFANLSVGATINPLSLTVDFDAASGQLVLAFTGSLTFFVQGVPGNIYRDRALVVANLRFEFVRDPNVAAKVRLSPLGGAGITVLPAAAVPDANLIAANYAGDTVQYLAEEAAICLNLRRLVPEVVANLVSFPTIYSKLAQFTLDPVFQIDQSDPEFLLLYGAPKSKVDPCAYVPRESTPNAAGLASSPPSGGNANGGKTNMNQAPLIILRFPKLTTLDKVAAGRIGLTLSADDEQVQTWSYWRYFVRATLETFAVAFDVATVSIKLSSEWRLDGDAEAGVVLLGGCEAARQKLIGTSIDSPNSSIKASAEASPWMDNDYLYLRGIYTVEPNIQLRWTLFNLHMNLVDAAINTFLRRVLGVDVNKTFTDSFQVPLLQRRGLLARPLDAWDKSLSATHLLIGVDQIGD